MRFPYGTAAFVLLLIAILAGGVVAWREARLAQQPYDLVFAISAKNHYDAYLPAVRAFEKEHGVRIDFQLVNSRALANRLQSAMAMGADVPDIVELLTDSFGIFVRGPVQDVQFVDLTDRIAQIGLDQRVPRARFSLWSSRGRIYGLPHDIHPVSLGYREDIAREWGVNVDELQTWDDFLRIGREVTRDVDGDGVIDRYMIDLPDDGGGVLRLLILQRGGALSDELGRVAFDSPEAADTVVWYVKATRGPDRIAFPAGWGQPLSRTMNEGLILFYITPDWRTKLFQQDVPGLRGKMRLMPLPAWQPGGRRTSTWGGSAIAFPRSGRNFELAWKFANHLYYNAEDLGQRFELMNILPPTRDAWDRPELKQPREFWGGQPIGRVMAELAPTVPDEFVSPYMQSINQGLVQALLATARYYEQSNYQATDEQLRAAAMRELSASAERVRREMAHNSFQPNEETQ